MEHATITLSTMISIVVGIISVAAGVYAVLVRIAFNTYEKSTEARFVNLEKDALANEAELKKQVYELREENHSLEKSQIKLEGEMRLLNSNHDAAKDDIASIKNTMITKTEFEPRMNTMENMLTTILRAVERSPGRYGSSSHHSAYSPTAREGGYSSGAYNPSRPPAGPSRETPPKGIAR